METAFEFSPIVQVYVLNGAYATVSGRIGQVLFLDGMHLVFALDGVGMPYIRVSVDEDDAVDISCI